MPRTFFSSAKWKLHAVLIGALLVYAGTVSADVAEAPSPTDAKYVAPSATEALKADTKIGQLFTLNMTKPYVLQRLTSRTYFFEAGSYATTFYVGDKGVLLFDPLEGHGGQLLQAIGEVTKLPVTAIVYSHYHADHIADAPLVLDAAKAAGVKKVRIIALLCRPMSSSAAVAHGARCSRASPPWRLSMGNPNAGVSCMVAP